jgi:hypothetical protein
MDKNRRNQLEQAQRDLTGIEDAKLGDCVEVNTRHFYFNISRANPTYPNNAKIAPNYPRLCKKLEDNPNFTDHHTPNGFRQVFREAKDWRLVQGALFHPILKLPFLHCWMEARVKSLRGEWYIFDFTSNKTSTRYFQKRDEMYQDYNLTGQHYRERRDYPDRAYAWGDYYVYSLLFRYTLEELKAVLVMGKWDFYGFPPIYIKEIEDLWLNLNEPTK